MNKTFYSYSFGCRVNHAEKEALDAEMVKKGYSWDERNPSLYIINSCSVTHKAEREVKQLVYQIRKSLPEAKIVVTGCAATNWLKTQTQVNGVDLLIDNKQKEYVSSILHKRYSEDLTGESIPEELDLVNSSTIHDSDKYLHSGRALFKIQDGCHRFCSYCIVPYLRGLPQSISIQTIVDHVQALDNKVKEVILTAINTEAYGRDTGEKLTDLLSAVIDNTSVQRLSLGSVHPWSVDSDFFTFYKKYFPQNRLVNFFHIPLQSGSNKMLGLMKRGYTREEFVEKLHTLAEINPMAFIGTDVIVGFLEENDKDFDDTYTFLETTPISKFHIFRYSQREHTAAFYMKNRLSEPTPQIKQKRAKALAELGKKKYEQFLQKHVGKTMSALFLKSENGSQPGLLENQIPVEVVSETDLIGQIARVKVEKYKEGKLFGKIEK